MAPFKMILFGENRFLKVKHLVCYYITLVEGVQCVCDPLV